MQRKRTYRCVGGPHDGLLCTLADGKRIRLTTQQDGSPVPIQRRASSQTDPQGADYDVRRLLAPDGEWHDFLVLSTLTTMEATLFLNRRRRSGDG